MYMYVVYMYQDRGQNSPATMLYVMVSMMSSSVALTWRMDTPEGEP